jgi:hypothetical protein
MLYVKERAAIVSWIEAIELKCWNRAIKEKLKP